MRSLDRYPGAKELHGVPKYPLLFRLAPRLKPCPAVRLLYHPLARPRLPLHRQLHHRQSVAPDVNMCPTNNTGTSTRLWRLNHLRNSVWRLHLLLFLPLPLPTRRHLLLPHRFRVKLHVGVVVGVEKVVQEVAEAPSNITIVVSFSLIIELLCLVANLSECKQSCVILLHYEYIISQARITNAFQGKMRSGIGENQIRGTTKQRG